MAKNRWIKFPFKFIYLYYYWSGVGHIDGPPGYISIECKSISKSSSMIYSLFLNVNLKKRTERPRPCTTSATDIEFYVYAVCKNRKCLLIERNWVCLWNTKMKHKIYIIVVTLSFVKLHVHIFVHESIYGGYTKLNSRFRINYCLIIM